MKVETLDELAAAFGRWRRKKRYIREGVPEELWERTLRAAQVYGTNAVARATKVEHSRLVERAKTKQFVSVRLYPCTKAICEKKNLRGL